MFFLISGLEIKAVTAPADVDGSIRKYIEKILKLPQNSLQQCLIKLKTLHLRM